MEKYLAVTFSDRSHWLIPASKIAESRAMYYAELETDRDPDSGSFEEWYDSEYEYTMSEDKELLDWAYNNMNWEDVKEFAVQWKSKEVVDYSKEWVNADKEIIEKEEGVAK